VTDIYDLSLTTQQMDPTVLLDRSFTIEYVFLTEKLLMSAEALASFRCHTVTYLMSRIQWPP
jgi:hypothetical protein